MNDEDRQPSAAGKSGVRWLRIAAVAAAYAGLLLLGHWSSGWLVESLGLEPNENALIVNDGAIWIGTAAYALLLAIPFVPGVEVSIALLAAFGSSVALQVYLGTLAAFVVSYLVGLIVPPKAVAGVFGAFGLTNARNMVRRLIPMSLPERLNFIVEHAPRRFVPFLVRNRYLAIILLLNLPGNAVLGGGGGVALVAGISRLFSLPGYLAAACIAAVPIPAIAIAIEKFW